MSALPSTLRRRLLVILALSAAAMLLVLSLIISAQSSAASNPSSQQVVATGSVQVIYTPGVGISIDQDGTFGNGAHFVSARYAVTSTSRGDVFMASYGRFRLRVPMVRTALAGTFGIIASHGTAMIYGSTRWNVSFHQVVPTYLGTQMVLRHADVRQIALRLN